MSKESDAKVCAVTGCTRPRRTGLTACSWHSRRIEYSSPGWVVLLSAILRCAPRLEGALCVGSPDTFTSGHPEHIAEAVRICDICPALDRCREWSLTLRRNRIHGVIAGQYRGWTPSTEPAGQKLRNEKEKRSGNPAIHITP